MLFARQTLALIRKELLITLWRHWFYTAIRALLFPVIFTVVIASIRNWILPSAYFGTGSPAPIRSFSDALSAAGSTRPRVVFINNGFQDGDIGHVIDQLSTTARNAGKDVRTLPDDSRLSSICPTSNKGISDCYGAVSFISSPTQGNGAVWNYTLFTDSALGGSVDVRTQTNDQQLYNLPFQHAIDSTITSMNGGRGLPQNMLQFPFTSSSEAQRQQRALSRYEMYVQSFLAFAFFIGLSGLAYHVVGHVTFEREKGVLSLIDAMMPNTLRWQRQATRILATHLAFDLVYLPGWVLMGIILGEIAFPRSNDGWLILLNVLAGLSLTSFSSLASSLFRKSQLSGISAIITVLVLALAAQFGEITTYGASASGVLATSVLFPPASYVYFLVSAAGFEMDGQAMNVSRHAPNIQKWSISPSVFLGLFAWQIFLYPIAGAIVERILWSTVSKARSVHKSQGGSAYAVRLQSFSKHYNSKTKKGKKVIAVDNLSLDLVEGSITVLLGANGSGKSTTLKAIAGLETITHGSIHLDGTGGLGLCPQNNVMWNELTVREHIEFFNHVKSTQHQSSQAHEMEVDRIISACDLENKRYAPAKTLSGGQKRKLQLAMMLAGGSRVCCIDEVSSGVDPIARRKLWDILLSERGSRTLLFTTHFLDEAEVLSDNVAMLSKGVLKAQGPVAALKQNLGGGYRIVTEPCAQFSDLENVTRHPDYNRMVYEVADTTTLATLIEELQRQGIDKYRLQGPSIEEVFLKLADEMRGGSEYARDLMISSDSSEHQWPRSPETFSRMKHKHRVLDLAKGTGLNAMQQTWVLFLKRLTILKHNFMPYVAALFVSLVVAGMVTRFFIGWEYPHGIPCQSSDQQSSGRRSSSSIEPHRYQVAEGYWVYGPPSRIPLETLEQVIPNNTVYSSSYYDRYTLNMTPTVDSTQTFIDYTAGHASELYYGGFYGDEGSSLFSWNGGGTESHLSGTSYSSAGLNLANSVIANQTIGFSAATFSESFSPANGPTTLVAVFVTLGFAIWPAFFALYPTGERVSKVRAMHYSNGILSSSLWIAYALFDFMFVLLISILTIVIWTTSWSGWYALGHMFVVLILYGLASTAFAYVVSLFASSQLAAIAFAAVMQVVISMLYLVGYVVSSTNAPATRVYSWFNYVHYTVALISPASNLMRALFMSLNSYSLICRGSEKASYPGEIGIYGAPILYLICQFIVLCAVLIFWESGKSLEVFGIHRKTKARDREGKLRQEAEATEDAHRLSPSNDGLRVYNVSKSFGTNVAAEDVTFGVQKSEKFALLGPNGAGKSTMISLIRGDLQPSDNEGSIHIGGDSLKHSPIAAKNHLGVCPQFDSVDAMTLVEHLRFYARARGVPDRERNVQEIIRRLGLQEHCNKLAKKLSGGTKRKLSLAIALISSPDVLLLDEPSSGMDPAAKRALWSTLSSVAAGRVLVITTHSMEEADALCDRASIMARRLLALGTIDDLRQQHGHSLYLHFVHKDAPYTSPEDMERMRQWALRNFAGAQVEGRTHHGQLRFSVPKSMYLGQSEKLSTEGQIAREGFTMGRLFRLVEAAKGDLGVSHYSISPSTLEQVFINVVSKHDVEEESSSGLQGRVGMLGKLLQH